MIIPFFIPDAGCPHRCVFCNQKSITGKNKSPDPASLPIVITEYLAKNKDSSPVEVAFYGGSFTALPIHEQDKFLAAVLPFAKQGSISGIRVSTRPDALDQERLNFLKKYHVSTIELGAQSMDDNVLLQSGRGHTSADTINAAKMITSHGFTLGLQLMVGLPGDSEGAFKTTVQKVLELKPDFTRLYPVLVIKDTPLAGLYQSGQYTPLDIKTAITFCKYAVLELERADINVIRIGLQGTEKLETEGTILAGPYHPAFRELVESSIMLDAMRALLLNNVKKEGCLEIRVNPKDLSAAIGQHGSNRERLRNEFPFERITITPDSTISERRSPRLFFG